MSTINRTVQTALRGQALHDAVDRMVAGLFGRAPYNMLGPTRNWVSATRLEVAAGSHMRGSVDIRDANPSTVTANIELLSGLAEGQRGRVEADLAEAAAQLPPPGGQPGPAVTRDTQSPRQTDVDWGSVSTGIQSFMQALPGFVGQVRQTADQTVAAARGETAPKPGQRPPHAPDVAEPIPLWQQKWFRWTLGAVAVGGVGLVLYRTVR